MNEPEQIDNNPERPYTLEELEAALVERSKPQYEPNQETDLSQPESAPETAETGEQSLAELPERMTVKALAETLGIKPKQLYDMIEIDAGDGTSVTLGQYKDQVKEFHRLEQSRKELTESRVKIENDLLQKRMALDKVAAKRGYQLTAQDLQEVEQQIQLHTKAQTALLAEIVPEFADDVVRDKGFTAINSVFGEYAFSEAEARFITDARLRKMAYDLHRLRQGIAEVESKEVKTKPRQAPGPFTPKANTAQRGQANRHKVDSAVNKLAQLLR
jgi:hypothetical protein